jgi:hypothetical protein
LLRLLRENWAGIKSRLIHEVDKDYGVFVPTGQRILNRESRLGAAIFAEAESNEIDPYKLADAVDHIWQEERESTREIFAARRAARKATGLTHATISRWEDAGRDYSEWPGLDLKARELARVHPELGIGPGYCSDGGVDDADYPGNLWALLRDHTETLRPKYDPEILRRAVELTLSSSDGEELRQLSFSAELWEQYLIRRGIP